MKFLRHFIIAFKEASLRVQYDFLAEQEDFWGNEDSKLLADFFAGTTGRKLKVRLTNYVCQSAITSTRKGDKYHCGIARGVALAVNAMEQHFTVSPPRSADNSEDQQQSSVADELALN
jgi:hypothetical protein